MKNENQPVVHEKQVGQTSRVVGQTSRVVGQASRVVGQASRDVGQASRLSEHSWRRHLPHYQLSDGYYFITFSTHNRLILQSSQKDCVFQTIRFLDDKKYELHASVILDDHVHIIINPTDTLSKIMHGIKSFTAHEINKMLNRKGKVWQDESNDRVIRSEDEFLEKINYIANNPIKADLATVYEDYKWLYIKGWINDGL